MMKITPHETSMAPRVEWTIGLATLMLMLLTMTTAGAAGASAGQEHTAAPASPEGPVQSFPTEGVAPAPNLSFHRDFLIAAYVEPADATLGATLEPVSDPLRAQLALPMDRGLIVASLADDGPAARAGLEPNDILLTLSDKPLARPADLAERLKSAGETAVTLRVLRKGKPVTLRVRPVYRVTLAADQPQTQEYYLGVAVSPVDDALRAHMDLPDGMGLLATQVIPGSPAEKAGIKIHDILIELGGKPLDAPETLVAQVQAARDKAATLKIIRHGKPETFTITPEARPEHADPHHGRIILWDLQNKAYSNLHGMADHPNLHGMADHPTVPNPAVRLWQAAPGHFTVTGRSSDPDRMGKRLDALDDDVKALRKAVEEIRDALKKEK
jgi:membrane-associated protease RseP (regulator of RpoE activity)